MGEARTVLVLSDVHYAGEAERQRGSTELQIIQNPLVRFLVRLYRHVIWRRDPFAHNHWLERFISAPGEPDWVVANGDYSCDTAFVGVSDDASLASARECLTKLRNRFSSRLLVTMGDHELGKTSLVGGRGGMRIGSFRRTEEVLRIEPFWKLEISQYVLIGITSSLWAWPVFQADALVEEFGQWQELRRFHIAQVHAALERLEPSQRLILFCHDPTALPFLWAEAGVRSRLNQLEATVIGHLHSPLFLWKSRLLSGMPVVGCLGKSVRRMSAALHEARTWRDFRIKLCPALGGIELLGDGGYLRMTLPGGRADTLRVERCLWRNKKPQVWG